MGWGRLDDGWYGHPKLLGAGLIARAIQSNAIAYCGHYLTDGYLPDAVIPRLCTGVDALFMQNGGGTPGEAPTSAASIDWPAYMVAKRLWDKVGNRPGYSYKVHDYLDYNPSRAELLAQRERNKHRGEVAARARWDREQAQQNRQDHASSIAPSIAHTNAPTQPNPSPKGEGDPTRGEQTNPLLPRQPGEMQEGGQAAAPPLHGQNLEDLSFENFWTYYPVHTGIEAARRAWKRVTRNRPEVKRAIFSALAAQRHWPKWHEGKIPNPARWLTEGRWQDEPPQPLPAGPSALDTTVGLAKVRGLVAGLAEDMAFKRPSGQAAAEEGRQR